MLTSPAAAQLGLQKKQALLESHDVTERVLECLRRRIPLSNSIRVAGGQESEENQEDKSVTSIDSLQLTKCLGEDIPHEKVVGVLKSLESRGVVDLGAPQESASWMLTNEGRIYYKRGLPEVNVLRTVVSIGPVTLISLKEECRQLEQASSASSVNLHDPLAALSTANSIPIGLQHALRLKWLTLNSATKEYSTNFASNSDCADVVAKYCPTRALALMGGAKDLLKADSDGDAVTIHKDRSPSEQTGTTCPTITAFDEELLKLALVSDGTVPTREAATRLLDDLQKRKLAERRVVKFYCVTPGPRFFAKTETQVTVLTQSMILDGSWASADFKPYNFKANGIVPSHGAIHLLHRMMRKFKRVLNSMNFEEMDTQNWVESSFWNFDSLFQPQHHPARDAQDTFFLSSPSNCNFKAIPPEYVSLVKLAHEKGCQDSIGWRYNWLESEASRNILRTHTTACSAKLLFHLAKQLKHSKEPFRRRSYYSIDRVFRNETLDATHLAEFHQIEGLVCDKNLGLADLIGVLQDFYKRIGIEMLRFKPAYNPYTEPSMEIFGFHSKLRCWIEVGNSGLFRPEMLLPMGFDPDVSVIAWGLSLERPTMIQHEIVNIRDLFGPRGIIMGAV